MPIYPAVRYRFAVPVLPTRASHLLSLLPHAFPPRRLPSPLLSPIPARTRTDFLSACDVVPVCHVLARRSRAHAYRLQSLHFLAPPHHPTPSTSPHAVHSASPSRYCGGSNFSSHGSAKGGKGKHGMPVRSVSARLQMVLVGYARCRTVCPFSQVIGAADTRY